MNCTCKWNGIGRPMSSNGCEVHPADRYGCDDCDNCNDYRPSRKRHDATDWPRCVCGHIAQAHNQSSTAMKLATVAFTFVEDAQTRDQIVNLSTLAAEHIADIFNTYAREGYHAHVELQEREL